MDPNFTYSQKSYIESACGSSGTSAGLRITRLWVRALLVSTCLYPWARYLVSIASSTRAHQGGIGRGKYYNLSVDEACTWSVAPFSEAKWLWRFSWYRNNRQQRFVSSGKRRYTNADIILLLLFIYSIIRKTNCFFPILILWQWHARTHLFLFWQFYGVL